MRRTLATVALAATVMIILAGCTKPEPLRLTEADNGSTQVLEPQQELIVELESNPTTGYKWGREGDLPQPLAGGDSEYTTDAGNAGLAGAGGKETFRFLADSKGEGTLRLKYWRSFEPTVPPVKTFEVTVRVGQ